ncbi:TauD/TfdA family dioxygenase [Ramlibacter agri]|nr:TauD/TfdA family dioxygenase [Ramlibacter agri]
MSPTARPMRGPSVWKGADFAADRSWLHELGAAQAGALVDAARRWEGRDFRALGSEEARTALAPLVPLADTARAELATRGFVLLRGVPVDAMTPGQIQLAYWAIGLLFGQGLTQNAQADFLCPVTDRGVDFGYSGSAAQQNVRGYQSKADLNYHCDPTDVVALLCVRKALAGGKSTIVSTPAIYNEMLRQHPEHLPVLLRGFPYDRKAEQWPGEAAVTERIPVFAAHDGRVSSRYARSYILGGAQKTAPLTAAETAALDCFDAIARREDMPLHMAFEPGDVQLLNNFTVLHGRTAYEDHADPARRRFLWRLWLHLGDEAPWRGESEAMRWAFARFGNLGRSVTDTLEPGEIR